MIDSVDNRGNRVRGEKDQVFRTSYVSEKCLSEVSTKLAATMTAFWMRRKVTRLVAVRGLSSQAPSVRRSRVLLRSCNEDDYVT